MIDAEEISLIFKGGVRWDKVIATSKRARLGLVSRQVEEEEAPPAPAPKTSSPSTVSRPNKTAILQRLRAKSG